MKRDAHHTILNLCTIIGHLFYVTNCFKILLISYNSKRTAASASVGAG